MNNPLFYLLLGLLVAWVGSYFFSIQYNRRRLNLLAAWLRDSLAILGTGTSSRWHGADRLDILVDQGRSPMREVAIVIGMQSRQFFRAIISLARGGRDSLSILISLQNTIIPGREFEIFEAKGSLPRNVMSAGQGWRVEEYRTNYKIAFRSAEAYQSAQRMLTLLLDDGFDLRRLSVRPSAPHIFMILNVGVLPRSDSAGLLRLIKNLADEVTTSPAKPGRNNSKPPTGKPTPLRPRLSPDTRLPKDGTPPPPGLDRGLTLPRSSNGNGHKHEQN